VERLREIAVTTPDGAARITLWHGDLTRLPPELGVDLLLVSAFPNSYQPRPGTLIGALDGAGVSVEHLARDKAADLRGTSGFWLSRPVGALNIGRVLCFEHAPLGTPTATVGEIFRNLGPFLPDEGARIATALLASGNQAWPLETVLPALVGAASEWMSRGLEIRELMIVEIDRARAEACAAVIDRLQAARREAADPFGSTEPMAPELRVRPSGPLPTPEPPAANLHPDEFERLLEKDFRAGKARPAPVPADPAPPPPAEVGDGPYDVFISYTSKDKPAVEALASAVRQVWPEARLFDYRHEIDPGLFWQRKIDEAIGNCGRIVALLSPEYFASPECTEEIMIARLRNKRAGGGVLLPIYWRSLQGDLELWLQIINYADCRESDAALLRALAGKLRPEVGAAG
jgi:hypothetical protein